MDALKYALGANTDHGLRRTNADKRKCVTLALASFGVKESSRTIAGICGVAVSFVADMKNATCSPTTPAKVTGKDGKEYPARKLPAKVDREEGEGEREPEAPNHPSVTVDREKEEGPRIKNGPFPVSPIFHDFIKRPGQVLGRFCFVTKMKEGRGEKRKCLHCMTP